MARTRFALVACLAAVVLGAAWLLHGSSDKEEEPSSGGTRAGRTAGSEALNAPSPELAGRGPVATEPTTAPPDPVATMADALLVTVLDAAGTPVPDVPVDLIAKREHQRSDKRQNLVTGATTDASGLARVVWPPGFSDQWRAMRTSEPSTRLLIEAAVAWSEPPAQDLGDDPLTHVPVVLRLPPGPRIDVELVDESGVTIPEQGGLALFWEPHDPTRQAPTAKIVNGRGRFPIVPADVELLVRCTGTQNWYSADATVPPQPADAGTVHVRCVLRTQRERIRARIVDPEKRPLASESLAVGFIFGPPGAIFTPNARERPLSPFWAETDAQGVLAVGLPGPAQPGRHRVLYVERPPKSPQGQERPRLLGFLPIEHRLQPGTEIDLGDLELGTETLLEVLEGRVVDDEGRPVEGATVHAEYRYTEYGTEKQIAVSRPFVTGADGAFVLRSPHAPPVSVELRAHKKGFTPAVIQATHGSRGLELRLGRP